MTLPPPQRPPWSVRAVRFTPWVYPFLAPLFMFVNLILPSVMEDPPRALPGDLCALVPADLLARVVPAAGTSESDTVNGDQLTNRATCSVSTDRDKATTSAHGGLSIEAKRYGDRYLRGAGAQAQDDFAGTKRFRLNDRSFPVEQISDLRRLGDSAYLAVVKREPADPQRPAQVSVAVFDGDVGLTVRYTASPSNDELAAAAAVAVARALLGGLR